MNATLHLDEDFKASLTTEISKCVHGVLADVQVQQVKPFMNQEEAAAVLGMVPNTFKKYFIKEGLRVYNIGSRQVIAYTDLVAFLKEKY